MYTSNIFSCFSTIIQCGALRTCLRCVVDGFYADPLDSSSGIVLEMITGTLYTVYSYIYTQYLLSVDSQSASWTLFTPDRLMLFVAGCLTLEDSMKVILLLICTITSHLITSSQKKAS